MRIISGTHKGTYIPVPKQFKARPTTDFAKEALFNILANYFDFEELSVLDLFAGTGSIGYEFASRGARQVDMVEINSRYADFIKSKAASMGFENIEVYHRDVSRILPAMVSKYDLIFADPPYFLEDLEKIPDAVFKAEILESDGWFILEHGKKHNFNNHDQFKEMRRYGSVNFSIFTH
ncbi:MAG: RsmD family RNA methyltransferase [Bacteroidales bacterium]|nr:RsmD family RNA methyltransferase [Bacteroidales bacterium]